MNWDKSALQAELDFAQRLGVPAGSELLAFDYWSDRFLGSFKGSARLDVPAEDCRVIAFVAKKAQPQIVSTSRHITQGGVDLQEVAWDSATKMLSGKSTLLVVGAPYTLVLSVPVGMSIASAQAGDDKANATSGADGETRVTFVPVNTQATWKIHFK